MKKCAIIIAAYDAAEFINTCVNSIMNQKPVDGWTIEIRVGTDGCYRTAQKMRIPFYASERNVGAYVIRNSLIYASPADCYSYFDADDAMMPDYLFRSLSVISAGADAVIAAKLQSDSKLRPIISSKLCLQAGGAITFTKKALDMVGGFRSFRCAADTDFMYRLEMAGIKIQKITDPLYYRRCHPRQLTRKSDTAFGSLYRRKSWAQMTIDRGKGIIKIDPEIVKLTRRIP